MRCHGVFPAKNLAGVGRLLLDGVAVYLALAGGRAKKTSTRYHFFMKRFNKIYLIDLMAKFQNGTTASKSLESKAVSPWKVNRRIPLRRPSPGSVLAATAKNV
jgi:hypothetical protein